MTTSTFIPSADNGGTQQAVPLEAKIAAWLVILDWLEQEAKQTKAESKETAA